MEKLCVLATTCKNVFNYQILNSCREKYQIVRSLLEAEWIVFPFCSCTDRNIEIFEKELAQIIKHKKENCKLIVTGCITYVKESKKDFLRNYDIDYIVPAENQVDDICKILGVRPALSSYNPYSIIGLVSIAEGCINKCTFCRVHYSNRPLVSVPIENIEAQIKDLVSKGIRYIELNALNSAQYGIDLYGKKFLHVLIQRISKIEGVKGILITAFSLSDIYDELVEELQRNNLINHISIDIQSGSDRLLKLMNVGHSVADIKKYFLLLEGKVKYTQIISGFPTETEEDMIETINLLKALQVPEIGISPYEDSKDIPSGRMVQLSEETIQKHTNIYKTAAKEILAEMDSKNNGKTFIGYISDFSLDWLYVYCPGYKYVHLAMKKEYFNFNLNDKIKVKLSDGKYSIVEVLEPNETETIAPESCKNKFIDFLLNSYGITSELGRDLGDLENIFMEIFWYSGGYEISTLEEYTQKISTEPDVLKNALIKKYKEIHQITT